MDFYSAAYTQKGGTTKNDLCSSAYTSTYAPLILRETNLIDKWKAPNKLPQNRLSLPVSKMSSLLVFLSSTTKATLMRFSRKPNSGRKIESKKILSTRRPTRQPQVLWFSARKKHLVAVDDRTHDLKLRVFVPYPLHPQYTYVHLGYSSSPFYVNLVLKWVFGSLKKLKWKSCQLQRFITFEINFGSGYFSIWNCLMNLNFKYEEI